VVEPAATEHGHLPLGLGVAVDLKHVELGVRADVDDRHAEGAVTEVLTHRGLEHIPVEAV